ncbi:MAG: heavy metal translocating P-type ATPase [Lachnospiraceae bacterium]|nr:heavy metal translocating P-type ATPase [Lachnospiraceae bacterium]
MAQEHHEHGHGCGHDHSCGDEARERKNIIIRLILAAVVFIAALIVEHTAGHTIAIPVYIASYLTVGFGVLKEAFESIREGDVFGEEFLMAIASLGALIIGQYAEAVAVMWLYCLGEFLQDLAVDKSRESIGELMDLRPDYANLIKEDGTEEKVDPDTVRVKDVIVIKPGEKVPLDGTVAEGESMLDTSSLTGEAVPRSVRPGDDVLSGCINTTGLIKVEVTKEFGESTASRILELVENAGERKSKSENFISKFAHVYTPIVCVLALVLAIVPSLITGNWIQWIERALTFLVVSCPCALVISVPLSFFAGIGCASKEGILVKGSNYLEALADTGIAVFDKTGTLTEGIFEVRNIAVDEKAAVTGEEMLELAAYAESNSSHPIAVSIVNAYGKDIDKQKVKEVMEMAGTGVTATVKGRHVYAGNAGGLEEVGMAFSKCEEVGTVVYVAVDGKYAGYILISDRIKEDAAEAISGLKACGIRKTVMLTGDNTVVADAVGGELGIDEVHAGLLPEDKVSEVERLLGEKSEKEKLLFAGDGVNDAPVLARADIGVAMGAFGSDAAIEAADVVIMDDKQSRLITAVKLSKRTVSIAKQNIIFAIAVKVIVLILSACGYATMWAAVFADVGVALLCILSSLRNMKPVQKAK